MPSGSNPQGGLRKIGSAKEMIIGREWDVEPKTT